MKTKVCKDCNESKSVSEFYKNGDRYNSYCKICHSKRNSKHPLKDQEPPEHEKRTIAWLQSHGIVAFSGKYLKLPNFNHVDVIAFGCLKIECKIPQKDNRIFFTRKQINTRYHADIIVIERDESMYSVYPITYEGFYRDGNLHVATPIDQLEYDKHLNRIDYIEMAFRRKRIAMMKQDAVASEQLTLFPKAS